MRWGKVIAVCLLIVLVESVHGTLRQIFLAPVIGDFPSRQSGVFTGSALILLISWLTARWLNIDTVKNQLRAGALWVVLIAVFEFSLGLALGYSRERMWSDYDLTQGGLMGLGLLFLFFSPMLGARMRKTQDRRDTA
ncbi:MAG: hypothetical protein ACKVQK_13960 [Burkholderiales bacterium]